MTDKLLVIILIVILLGTRTIDRRMRDEMQNLYPKLFGKKVTKCSEYINCDLQKSCPSLSDHNCVYILHICSCPKCGS